MATEKAERGRQSHAAAYRKHLARIAADARRRPQGRESTMSSGFGEGVFLDFRTDRKNITDGLPAWPAEAYFIRRWPSFGDVLVAYQEDLEPLALDPRTAAVKDESVNRKALTAARRDVVGKVLSALGRSERNYDAAEQALVQWYREHAPEGLTAADALGTSAAEIRVAWETFTVLRNVLHYFRDPRGFMEEMALEGTGYDLPYLLRFSKTLQGIVWTWGPAAFLNTAIWAAVAKSSPLGIHSIMARVNSAGPAKLGHRAKGSRDNIETSERLKEKDDTIDSVEAICNLIGRDHSKQNREYGRKKLKTLGQLDVLIEAEKLAGAVAPNVARRKAVDLFTDHGNHGRKRVSRAAISQRLRRGEPE